MEQGIDSISLNPDTAIKTALHIAAAERRSDDVRDQRRPGVIDPRAADQWDRDNPVPDFGEVKA